MIIAFAIWEVSTNGAPTTAAREWLNTKDLTWLEGAAAVFNLGVSRAMGGG